MRVGSLLIVSCALIGGAIACDAMSLIPGSESEEATLSAAPTWTDEAPTLTSVPTEQPSETPIPATPTVTHVLMPGEPPGARRFVADVNSSARADERSVTSGDNYTRNRFERPFASGTMEYRSDVDITRAEMTFDDTWFYFSIQLAGTGPSAESMQATYAIELDFNRDGRGDWLITVENPSSFTWTTDDVAVLLDIDGDVGGNLVMQADDAQASGDGFETTLFDSGRGDDPDAAWARLDPNADSTVQLAVKRQFLRSVSFLWGAWADAGLGDPGLFDYVDRFSENQAGSPLEGSSEYPLKEVSALDNTCRMYQGFTPTGSEPGICVVFATVQNCTFHPMLMAPGNVIISGQTSANNIKQDILPGTYSFYDQNVLDNDDNHPVVLTVTLQAGQTVQITEDGNGNTWSCP